MAWKSWQGHSGTTEHVGCDGAHDPAKTSCIQVHVPVRVEPHVLAAHGPYVELVVHVGMFGNSEIQIVKVDVRPLERRDP